MKYKLALTSRGRFIFKGSRVNLNLAEMVLLIARKQGMNPTALGLSFGIVHPRVYNIVKGKSHSVATVLELMLECGYEVTIEKGVKK